jgi:hypothetical protein
MIKPSLPTLPTYLTYLTHLTYLIYLPNLFKTPGTAHQGKIKQNKNQIEKKLFPTRRYYTTTRKKVWGGEFSHIFIIIAGHYD